MGLDERWAKLEEGEKAEMPWGKDDPNYQPRAVTRSSQRNGSAFPTIVRSEAMTAILSTVFVLWVYAPTTKGMHWIPKGK